MQLCIPRMGVSFQSHGGRVGSLQRHLLAKSKWDEEHRLAARSEGVKQVKHRCPREGCTYATVREDNLKRHMNTCAQ